MKPIILQLRGIHASDLFNCCSNPLDKQDPCVQINVGSKRVETARKTDAGTDAVFDEEFDVILKEDLSNVELKVEVFHKNALGFKTHLGIGSKKLLELIPTYDNHVSFVLALYNNTKKVHKGQVTITGFLSNQNSTTVQVQQLVVPITDTNSSGTGTKQVFEVPKDSTLYSKFDAFKIDELVQIMNNCVNPEQIVDAILTSPILIQTKYIQQASDSSEATEKKLANDGIVQANNGIIQASNGTVQATDGTVQASDETQQNLPPITEKMNQNVVKSIKTSDFSSFVDPLMIYNDTKPKDISKYTSGRSKSVVGMVDYSDAPPVVDPDDKTAAEDAVQVAAPEKVEKKFPKILKKVLESNRQNNSTVESASSRKTEFLDAVYLQMLSNKKPPTETPTKSKQLEKYRRLTTTVVRSDHVDLDDSLDI